MTLEPSGTWGKITSLFRFGQHRNKLTLDASEEPKIVTVLCPLRFVARRIVLPAAAAVDIRSRRVKIAKPADQPLNRR